MAFRGTFGECTPYIGGVAVGIYATAVYLTASGLELGWIIESDVRLPSAAYILTAEYFSSLLLALFLMVGLLLRNFKYLLVWLVLMMAFFFPECGLVLFMSLYYWGLSSSRGLAEFVFYVCRAVFNVLSIVCIHWLQAAWKREEHVLQRLQTLHVGSLFSEVDATSKGEPESSNVHFSHEIFYSTSRCQESELLFMSSSNDPPPPLVRSHSPSSAPVPHSKGKDTSASCFCPKPGSSEFDAASFNEYLVWKLRQPQDRQANVVCSSQSDIVPSFKGDWDSSSGAFYNPAFSDTRSSYSTHSLERVKHSKAEPLRRARSLGDITSVPDLYVLQRLPERPFEYLQRPGSVVIEDADSSSSHSIRDVAL